MPAHDSSMIALGLLLLHLCRTLLAMQQWQAFLRSKLGRSREPPQKEWQGGGAETEEGSLESGTCLAKEERRSPVSQA